MGAPRTESGAGRTEGGLDPVRSHLASPAVSWNKKKALFSMIGPLLLLWRECFSEALGR